MTESTETASPVADATQTTTETTAATDAAAPPADAQRTTTSTLLTGETAEATGEGGDGSGEAEGDDSPADAPAVPEAYEFKLPEGMEGMQVDQALADQFTPVFKDMGLTQEQADKLVTAYAKHEAGNADKVRQGMADEWMAKVIGWEKAAEKDPEYGGENYDTNLEIAKNTLNKYSSPELKKLLAETGLGSHPDLIRAFVRIGKATAEDRPDQSGGVPAASESEGERAYRYADKPARREGA